VTTAADGGFVELRIATVVGVHLAEEESTYYCIVPDAVSGEQQLPIAVGRPEAMSLALPLGETDWRRPMTYQFTAAPVHALGGHVRQVRIDRVVDRAYAATVDVDGPLGGHSVDARPSDALNLGAVVDAPILAAPEVLAEAQARRAGDSAEAVRLRRALTAPPMTISAAPR